MLTIRVKEQEFWDPIKEMFVNTKPITVRMEHSLISISKWEAIWEKPFLPVPGRIEGMHGPKEEISYIKCMIIGDVPDYVATVIWSDHGNEIKQYLEKKQSATTVHRMGPKPPSRQIITTELIYYWMAKFGIPFECERWHFNRLLMLIDVCSVKESSNDKKGRLSHIESAKYRQRLNKARRSR